MKNFQLFWIILVSAIFFQRGYSGPTTVTEDPDDWEEEDDSSEADDDGRVYKNPRNFPSPDCPRDEEQATLLGQKCLRKCSSDEDCKSKKKKCLCDGACGMSCIKPDRECPELEHPALGTVVMSGRTFGSRASYTCNHGYHVVGLQTRVCQAYGSWSGSEPACKQNIYCLAPPTIEHARHSALPEQATFDLDSTVQYHCHLGYATAGFPRAKCLAIDGQASWYGPDISCEPRSCGQPVDPANSGWHAGECYTYGCRITYHCGEGYELVGKQAADCQADGVWAPKEVPTCVLVTAVQCPQPDNPRNGKAIYTSVSYNSVVSYECRYGYTLIGESSRRCGADKKWSGSLPQCKEINCGHPGTLYNGWLENVEAGFGLGSSIIFRCQPEMLLVGNASTVCQIDGRWRYPLPQCLAPCVVPSISQGIVVPIEVDIPDTNATQATPIGMGIGSSKVRHGTILEVICDEHYEFPLTSLSPPTCNNGTWSTIPRCVPARCKTLPKAPKFAMVISPKTEHGMKARFKCKDGWQLATADGKPINDSNEHVLTCLFGNWSGEYPICQEVYCQFLGIIPNGKVLLVGNMGLYDYRPYVKKVINNKQIMYDCDKGYVLENGASGATCIGGKWQPSQLPDCLLGQHPRLRWTRKKRSVDLKFTRAKFMLNHYRNIKRKHFDHHKIDEFIKKAAAREKRSIINESQKHFLEYLNNIVQNESREKKKRENRDFSEIDRAYSKYYEKIKARYRNYVKNLFPNQKQKNSLINNSYPMQPVAEEEVKNTRKIQDGRWFNAPEFRYRAIQKARSSYTKDLQNEEIDADLDDQPVAIPTINDSTRSNKYETSIINTNASISNYYPSYNEKQQQIEENNENGAKKHSSSVDIAANIYAQLQSQIVRRKRDTDDDGKDDDIGVVGKKKRGPCEPITELDHMQMEIVKPPKNPNDSFGHGMVLKITCNSGYHSNIQTVNSTVRCNKGVWKPVKPVCTVTKGPCFVPSVEHGSYYEMPSSDPLIEQIKPTTSPLTPLARVDNGITIAFQCDTGYNIQGSNSIKCIDGNWSSQASPECLPAPCVLPEILHAVYQGGYRLGLTIAHGSHVMVVCENGAANTIPPVQMDCALGLLTPTTVSCSFTASRKSRDDEMNSFIVDDGNVTTSSEEGGDFCGPPSKDQAMLIYKNEDTEIDDTYPAGTEISFSCIPSITGERTTWKIVCENGHWIGRAHDCEDDERLYNTPLANGSCVFKNTDPHVANFYNDLEIRESYVEFPAGTTLISRYHI
ncbi:hypothetical protein PVAND_010551 [Polypedilum vanderplanki]|uniref:Uncharacterized protein n=1 Tax=Polypedilum vanderplanki TaxID=319348 RepID=A0A9J6CGK8_POLVA|nr:hypothetical protein PVAND_010551 [Polypedilum vanderplanki]